MSCGKLAQSGQRASAVTNACRTVGITPRTTIIRVIVVFLGSLYDVGHRLSEGVDVVGPYPLGPVVNLDTAHKNGGR